MSNVFEYFRPHFDRRLGRANSNYTPLQEGRRDALLSALEAAQKAHAAYPAYPWGRLRAMV